MGKFPRCKGCRKPIRDKTLVKAKSKGRVLYWHKRHAPVRRKRNLFGFHPITGPIRRRLAARRVRKAMQKGRPDKVAAAAINPARYSTETNAEWNARMLRRLKNPATFRRVGKHVRSFGRKHRRAVRAVKVAGRVGEVALTVAVPEAGIGLKAARHGARALRRRKKNVRRRRNPLPKTALHYLSLADREIGRGHYATAREYIEKAQSYAPSEGTVPPAIDAVRKKLADAQGTLTPSQEAREKRYSLYALRNPMPTALPEDFASDVTDELVRHYPDVGRFTLFEAFETLWKFALTERSKEQLLARWRGKKPALDASFFKLYDDFRAGKFVEDGKGHLVPRKSNPGQGPIVDGAVAEKIWYTDENGQAWVHEFGERTGKQPRIRVKRGLLNDRLEIKTKVTPAGITD